MDLNVKYAFLPLWKNEWSECLNCKTNFVYIFFPFLHIILFLLYLSQFGDCLADFHFVVASLRRSVTRA